MVSEYAREGLLSECITVESDFDAVRGEDVASRAVSRGLVYIVVHESSIHSRGGATIQRLGQRGPAPPIGAHGWCGPEPQQR